MTGVAGLAESVWRVVWGGGRVRVRDVGSERLGANCRGGRPR